MKWGEVMVMVNPRVCRICCVNEFENNLDVTFVMPLSMNVSVPLYINLSDIRHCCVLISCEMWREFYINTN